MNPPVVFFAIAGPDLAEQAAVRARIDWKNLLEPEQVSWSIPALLVKATNMVARHVRAFVVSPVVPREDRTSLWGWLPKLLRLRCLGTMIFQPGKEITLWRAIVAVSR
jgi:hypothetical protein